MRLLFNICLLVISSQLYAATDNLNLQISNTLKYDPPIIKTSSKNQSVGMYIPEQAYQYFTIIKEEQTRFMPYLEHVHYIPALIEHESCISLKHSKCWNPKSQLKSKREEGAGLIQITRAYKDDGSLRFDSLNDMKRLHQAELKDLSWSNVYTEPRLQIRTLVLMMRGNYEALYDIKDKYQRLIMTDPAYNGGMGGLQKERRVCGLAKNCDPNIWFENVEKHCMKSLKPLYAGRSACDINRHHVQDIFFTRLHKYKSHF